MATRECQQSLANTQSNGPCLACVHGITRVCTAEDFEAGLVSSPVTPPPRTLAVTS